jgi:hypothetical protein
VYAHAFTGSLQTVFLVATGIALVGFACAWLLPDRKLRETIAGAAREIGGEGGETFPQPGDDEAEEQTVAAMRREQGRDQAADFEAESSMR